MTVERWVRVKEVLQHALDVDESRRSDYVAEACADDLELRREVESWLISCERPDALLETPAMLRSETLVGRELGPYRILKEIGHGGMGAVYLGERADRQYEKQVAIKVIRGGLDSALIGDRFRRERQILASLEHPNIGRMLDGGATPDGLAYIVMEFIEGEPIDRYCGTRALPITERLQLFRTVCAAAHYAHQHLVVHRDIKPANILVTLDGQPKLLDFGIAKLLKPEPQDYSATGTLAGALLMTPAYASPEQVQGAPITIATDVYSLGVVLYELLAGRLPFELGGRSAQEVMTIVTSAEPPKPSAAPGVSRRAVEGDLDHIVLKALRKEPQERYSSAAEFAADIARHLEGLPVLARKGTMRYRAAKFVRRNKAAVLAAGLVLASLIGGIVATSREAAIAERRFNDVRHLANSVVFEMHDAIKDLPGSTPARELLVKRALEYLDNLDRESAGDRALQRELAAAYEKVGDDKGTASTPISGIHEPRSRVTARP